MSIHPVSSTGNDFYVTKINQQTNAAARTGATGFLGVIANKAQTAATSFAGMLNTSVAPHITQTAVRQVDASKISPHIWCRNDFPFEKFFDDNADYDAILNWKPSGVEPAMSSPEVQNRLRSTFGKMVVLVPPVLQEKMDKDPQLARKVADSINVFIADAEARVNGVSSTLRSACISLNEDGEIANWVIVSGGDYNGPSEKDAKEFAAKRKAKAEREEEHRRINEEASINRKRKSQEIDRKHYQSILAAEAVFMQVKSSDSKLGVLKGSGFPLA